MKLRYVDLLNDREYASLGSTRTDRKLFVIGIVSLMTMCVTGLGFFAS